MARVPVLAIALLVASVGGAGFAYLKTRPEAVVHVDRVAQAAASHVVCEVVHVHLLHDDFRRRRVADDEW
jgi:hypothetical protein